MSTLKFPRSKESRPAVTDNKAGFQPMGQSLLGGHKLSIFLAAIVTVVLQASAIYGQAPVNPCPTQLTPGQNLFKVPEIVSSGGKLRGTLLLSDQQQWMPSRVPASAPSDQSRSQCVPQYVRMFRESGAVASTASSPGGVPGTYALPRPGPTLRARVGDLVQLTFVNQINASNFGASMDRGETGKGGGCDESTAGYPGNPGDKYPDCFHGSSTGNIHFHGTHTNPNTTADNVFIEIRPSLRVNNKPIVTPDSVAKSFNDFFTKCEAELATNPLKEWPRKWTDLPKVWRDQQLALLKRYDDDLEKKYGSGVKKLLPIVLKQLAEGAWPQYYIGAYPYCFRLPNYTEKTWPPSNTHAGHLGAGTGEQPDSMRPLMMGQAPGTHWYHAHKHGSTAINVANGMTGAFIIEGQYDDDLNTWYGANWTRTQPLLVINQLGVSPNLMRGGGGAGAGQQDKGPDFSVNGQLKPVQSMRPGEVQMWRIVNSSGRAGAYFTGPPDGFEWRQLAQDGVQFIDANYQQALNQPFLLASGNRADLLVKAPAKCPNGQAECTFSVIVKNEVDPSDLAKANPLTLLSVKVSGQPLDPTSKGANFIPTAPSFPPFLADIADNEIKATRTMVFSSTNPGPGNQHTIDGKKFDGEVGAVVLLNQAEEWKVVNYTGAGQGAPIAHPFHIHINPFQLVEVFDPNISVTATKGSAKGTQIPKYVFDGSPLQDDTVQCALNPADPTTWKDCHPFPKKNLVWWDVFPIPSGRVVKTSANQSVSVPGYFKMRSRFVDYAGFYVLHCHILAHEDRGMMTIVEVAPVRTPYSHH